VDINSNLTKEFHAAKYFLTR